MIEIHCQLRCVGCGSLRTTVIQMRIDDFARLAGGSLSFCPKEELRLLDLGNWRVDAGALRCPRC